MIVFFRRLCLLALFSLAESAGAQMGLVYDELLHAPDWSSRNAAMGGVGTALTGSPAAGVYNPAALAVDARLGAMISGQHKTASSDLQQSTDSQLRKYALHHDGQNDLNSASFSLPFKIGIHPSAIALYLHNLSNLHAAYTWRPEKPEGDYAQETSIKHQGARYGLTTAFSFSPFRDFFLGVSITLQQGGQQIDTSYVEQLASVRRFSQTGWENNFSGVTVAWGYLWRPHSHWSLGGRMTFPYRLSLTDIQFVSPSGRRTFSEQIQLNMPITVNTGVAWHPFPHWLVSFDYCRNPWNQLSGRWGGNDMMLNFSRAHSYHFGVERSARTAVGRVSLRGGYRIIPRQLYEFDEIHPDQRGKQIRASGVTGGIGLLAKSWGVDLALTRDTLSFPSDWYFIGSSPLTIRQATFHLLATVHYFL
ncbi:hypothetical protein GX408_00585 [bacterium]|nr:hypothetical protein [bacterium]